MSTLRGCAFEDLVSAGRAERNAADDYLKRRGWKESAGTRAYIEALRRSSMSLYEVSDIVGGVSFLARDLVRGGDPGAGWVPHLAPPRRSRRPCGPDASALVTALESHIKALQGDTGSSKAIRGHRNLRFPTRVPPRLSLQFSFRAIWRRWRARPAAGAHRAKLGCPVGFGAYAGLIRGP
jgi:hypothetical protein